MTKYPLWKYIIIILALLVGIIYITPNFYGEIPAVQISSSVSNNILNNDQLSKISQTLKSNNVTSIGTIFEGKTVKLKFTDIDVQLKAREIIQNFLGSDYVVALNLVSNSPNWLIKLGAFPMFLGLDLRGGIHFLLEMDMKAGLKKVLEKYATDIKINLKKNQIRYGNIDISDNQVIFHFRDNNSALNAKVQINKDLPNISLHVDGANLVVDISVEESLKIQEAAVKQNLLILHNRVNELGVAEPIIQQQGRNRIMVELPGVQDTARAKAIIGRTATLEVRMVDDDKSDLNDALAGNVPVGKELLNDKDHYGDITKILVNKEVELTGDSLTDAQPGFDENGSPSVNLRLDDNGSSIFKELTHDNIGKRMAMVLVDNGKAQVVTAPVIRTEIGGGQVQISGAMTVEQANDVALLLRSGSLAAPMSIAEERAIGPSLGKENISKGFHSVLLGFILISIFMIIYYQVFGVISIISLAINLVLLTACLSMLQATLTLPGIAAIALALGMAIDSNVLINERIREELRNDQRPHTAIELGYNHAWATILDSNVTTLIAGLALLAFGSGSVKGFAVVHCLGILTSMFSAVFVSRGILSLLYYKHKINKLHI